MRKALVLILSLVMALGVMPATAAPVDELTDLADYYPDDTVAWGVVRTDDAYFETLNGVAQRLSQRLPMIPEDFTLQDAVFTDINFNETIRPWLGDTAAFGTLLDADTGEPVPAVALAVADREAAQVFLGGLTADSPNEYEQIDVRGGTLYQSNSEFGDQFLLLDDVLLTSSQTTGLAWLKTEIDAPLSENDVFNERLNALPEDDYNGAFYIDLTGFAPLLAETANFEDLQQTGFDFIGAYEALGAQAGGFTILDDRSLVLDLATNIANPDALEAAGFPVMMDSEPLNSTFASNIPADAPLVIHNQNLARSILMGIDQLETAGNIADEMFESGELSFNQQGSTQLDNVATFIRLSVQGMAGAPLEDVVGWMTGEYAATLTPQITENGQPSLETATIIEATDSDAAETFVNEWFPNLLTELGIDNTIENGTLVTPLVSEITGNEANDHIAATNGELLALGTRASAEFALSDDAGLTDDATFQTAQAWFLPDAHSLAYINVAPLQPVVETLGQMEPDFQMIATVLPVLESASITAIQHDDGSATARFVLTLAE